MKRLTLLLLCSLAAAGAATAADPAPATHYTDAATLTVIGKALPTELPYNRIDTTRHTVPANTRGYCYHSTGIAVVFRTDSPNIRARWQTSGKNASANMTAIAQKGLDLYIRRDGEWVFAGMGRPKTSGKYDKHEAALILDMEPGEKECLLYLPLYDRVDKLEIGTDEGTTILPAENPFRHRIVIHGSSITHGIAAGRAGMSYASLFSRHTGLYCINLGFSGRCTLQPEFAEYLAQVEADAFILDTFSNPSAEMIAERFDTFVDILRKGHPDTPLIFLQTIVRETRNFNRSIDRYERDKRQTAERCIRERMKRDKHIYFVDPGNLLGGDHNATVDGVHPTDLGFERMLDRIEPPIRKILKRYGIR